MHYSARGSSANVAPLLGYVDSDFANSSDRKSITGFCFFQGPNLITWCSKHQTTVTMSTIVAEYYAFYKATTEAVCFCMLLKDLGYDQKGVTTIREDNQTAIRL